ncbi:hypothetical protein D8674_028737 [Pyrus ussuriensis x Pyrus communis]|uniref:Uncharacterized protein n=1 Tax=Pyrus ussuriensis x Pyrus communis TaxID=2448454 RepID=A0A5N5I4G1_9ROSA|nr:hypothetical protein D8674_028737 [Pyrus ussuriensis x Pyrus communis]
MALDQPDYSITKTLAASDPSTDQILGPRFTDIVLETITTMMNDNLLEPHLRAMITRTGNLPIPRLHGHRFHQPGSVG